MQRLPNIASAHESPNLDTQLLMSEEGVSQALTCLKREVPRFPPKAMACSMTEPPDRMISIQPSAPVLGASSDLRRFHH